MTTATKPLKLGVICIGVVAAEMLPPMERAEYIDLFAGIGGLRVGADASGGQCVFTSEHDRYAGETYKEN